MFVVFSSPVCSKCDTLKSLLDSKGIQYRSVNVWEDEVSAKVLQYRGLRSLPQVFRDTEDGGLEYIGTTVEV
jgi:glutaredoxin